jgi:hypothetical protein
MGRVLGDTLNYNEKFPSHEKKLKSGEVQGEKNS